MNIELDLTVEELEALDAPLVPWYWWYPIVFLATT